MRFVLAVLLAAAGAFAQLSKINYPTDYSTVTSGTRANLKANFDEIKTKDDPAKDSIDEVRGRMSGYSGDFTLSSLDHLRLRLDTDGSGVGRFVVLNGATGDSVFRASEDSTWRAFGAGVGTKLTLSDSILAATARISGLTASRLMATNAGSTLASVADLTAWIAGTANQVTAASDGDGSLTLSIPNGFTLPSASPTFTGLTLSGLAGTGTRLTTSTSTGVQGNATTISGTYAWSGNHAITGTLGLVASSSSLPSSDGNPLLFATAEGGSDPFNLNGHLVLQGRSGGGSGRDIIFYTGTTPTMRYRLTTGGTHTFSSDVVLSSALGVTGLQSNSEAIAFVANGTSGAGRIYKTAANGLQLRGATGSSYDFGLESASGSNLMLNPTGTTGITFPGAAGVTFTAAPTFSSVTASQFLLVDGSKALTSVAGTGSGSVVRATSPTISGLTLSGTTATGLTASRTLITDGSGNMAVNTETGTGSHMRAASPTTTGTLTGAAANFSGAVSASQMTLGGGEAFVYGDTSFTLTGTTGWTTTPSGTAYATRIGRVVTLYIPYITGTSNTISGTLSGIPSGWIPARSNFVQLPAVINNGTQVLGSAMADVTTSGTIVIYLGPTGSFTSSGQKAVGWTDGQTITYQLQ